MAACYWSIIRYVPDPIREEFVNVGVIVISADSNDRLVTLLDDWTRVRHFDSRSSGGSIDELVGEVGANVLRPGFTLKHLKRWQREWYNMIQLSPVRASILEPGALMERLSRSMLGKQMKESEEKLSSTAS